MEGLPYREKVNVDHPVLVPALSRPNRPHRRHWVALVAGLLAGSALSAGTLILPGGSCSPGPVIAQVNDTLTAVLVLNSPFLGSANGSVPIQNGTLNLTIFANDSGSVWGYFQRVDWTIQAGQATVNTGGSCSGAFFATGRAVGSSGVLPLFNSGSPAYQNDSSESDWVNISGTPGPVYFHNQFYAPTSRLSTCGTNASVQVARSNHITVEVQFTYKGTTEVVQATIPVSTTYRYFFPADGGTWQIDNLSAPGGPGGGWAFSYSTCP